MFVLRDPLFFLLPLLAVIYLVAVPVHQEISDITVIKNGNIENIRFPYTVDMEKDEVFYVSFILDTKKQKTVKLNIIPDDCLQEVLINGEKFSLEGIKGLCSTSRGAHFDFSEHTVDGLNIFALTVINSGGGPAGLNVIIKQFSLTYWIFALLSLAYFSLILWRLRNRERLFKLVLLLAATFAFYLIASNAGQKSEIIPKDSIAFLAAIFFGASSIFLLNKRVNYSAFLFILTAIAAFMLVRGGLLYFKSIDYNNFLNPWIKQMQELSFRRAISAKIGDYNMPYLYILALISRINISSLYLIKIVSIAFDAVLAYYVMKVVSLKFNSINVQIAAFVAILGIPTVILNGAFWAQCDVIYTTLAIAALYYGCTGKGVKSLVFFGLAFSVKLQTIFMAPLLIVFIFTKRVKVTHLWIPVLTFYATLVPALIAGKPFVRTFSIYFEQMNSYPEMSLNIPNIYVLLGNVKFEYFNFAAIFLAVAAVASLLYFLYLNREKITLPADYVHIAFAFALLVPMFLPRMHERYFFMADVLSVVFVFFNKKRWYFAPIIILGSFMTYNRFLLGRDYIVPMEYASLSMIFITVMVVKDLVERERC
jgi:Gpi18-like mannosyltransferase